MNYLCLLVNHFLKLSVHVKSHVYSRSYIARISSTKMNIQLHKKKFTYISNFEERHGSYKDVREYGRDMEITQLTPNSYL